MWIINGRFRRVLILFWMPFHLVMVLLFDLPGALLDATIATMPPRKKPSPKKPPVRKRRANTLLQGPGKKDSSSGTVKPAVNVPATPVPKTPSLRLFMTSHKTAIPALRLNGPKPPMRQRPDLVTDSLLDLIEPSSPYQISYLTL